MVEFLKDTVDLMCSEDYKERFKAEYYQLKIRYEKLKNLNNRIEAYEQDMYNANVEFIKKVKKPEVRCPNELLLKQQEIMRELLHVLEVRAILENIDL